MGRTARAVVAVAAGLALADGAIVVLALPVLLSELDASIEGVAAVIGVYTLVLALSALIGVELMRRLGAARLGGAGFALFALASVGCGLAGDLEVLVTLRGVQALGAGAGLVAAFALLDGGGGASGRPNAPLAEAALSPGKPARLPRGGSPGRRLWVAAGVLGTVVGPALGGALTELLDWRAIFLAQAPVLAAAALACLRAPALMPRAEAGPAMAGPRVGPAIALALLSAALTGVVFLLVLLVVTGWSLSPLEAAGVVSILPVAALVATTIPGPRRGRAAAGCALVGAGVLTLAFLPGASVAWTVAPQLLAGLGFGLALPALAGGLLPERTVGQAAALLAARHLGITLALAVLAPVIAVQIDDAVADVRERGTALVLDARLPPLEKLDLVGAATADLDPVDPRGELARTFDENAGRFEGEAERGAYADLRERVDALLVDGVNGAFVAAFLICGGLGLAAALAVRPPPRGREGRLALGVVVVALALPAAQAAALGALAPEPVRIADPCADRALPDTGGFGGAVQDAALGALDRAACEIGSSREELALALADGDRADAFELRYGVDPRSLRDLLPTLLGDLLG